MDRDDVFTFRTLGDVTSEIIRDLEVKTQDLENKRPRIVGTPGKFEAGSWVASGGRGAVPGAHGGNHAPGTNRHSARGATVTKGNRRL